MIEIPKDKTNKDFQLVVLNYQLILNNRGIKLEFKHKPVMLSECLEGLKIKPEGIYVDGTLGGARAQQRNCKKTK